MPNSAFRRLPREHASALFLSKHNKIWVPGAFVWHTSLIKRPFEEAETDSLLEAETSSKLRPQTTGRGGVGFSF